MNTRAFLAEFPFLGQEVDAVDLLLLALCATVLLIILAVLCRFYNSFVFTCFFSLLVCLFLVCWFVCLFDRTWCYQQLIVWLMFGRFPFAC